MSLQYQHEGICEPSQQPQLDKVALKKLVLSSILCIVFMVGEVIGGIVANSLAIGTDAAHLFVDLISFFISILSVYLAARKPSLRLNFGWYRAEAIGALFSIMFIWIVTVVLVGLAILRIASGDYEINCSVMLITSAAGLVLNIIMMMVLHGGSHHHHHHHRNHNHDTRSAEETNRADPIDPISTEVVVGDSSPVEGANPPEDNREDVNLLDTVPLAGEASLSPQQKKPGLVSVLRNKPMVGMSVVTSSVRNINVRAAFIHVLGDMVQSLGVVVAAIVIYFKPDYKIADPICTFFFSFLVTCTTFQILKDTILILMEACPKHLNPNEIESHLLAIPRVRSVHNLRVWVLKTDRMVASVHLVLERRSREGDPSSPSEEDVLAAAVGVFGNLFAIEDCTVQLEQNEVESSLPAPDESLLIP